MPTLTLYLKISKMMEFDPILVHLTDEVISTCLFIPYHQKLCLLNVFHWIEPIQGTGHREYNVCLYLAVERKRHISVVKECINDGADINAIIFGSSILSIAISKRYREAVSLLLNHNVIIDNNAITLAKLAGPEYRTLLNEYIENPGGFHMMAPCLESSDWILPKITLQYTPRNTYEIIRYSLNEIIQHIDLSEAFNNIWLTIDHHCMLNTRERELTFLEQFACSCSFGSRSFVRSLYLILEYPYIQNYPKKAQHSILYKIFEEGIGREFSQRDRKRIVRLFLRFNLNIFLNDLITLYERYGPEAIQPIMENRANMTNYCPARENIVNKPSIIPIKDAYTKYYARNNNVRSLYQIASDKLRNMVYEVIKEKPPDVTPNEILDKLELPNEVKDFVLFKSPVVQLHEL